MSKIISQIKAAELAGVTKQALSKLKNTRSFFTKQNKVDTSHADWQSYLNEHTVKKNKKKAKDEPDDFQWLNAKPTTIQEEKIYADIIQKRVDIDKDLDILIEKPIVIAILGKIAKGVQTNFLDHSKRVSPKIAAKLGLPGVEKTIEKIENPEMKKNIENMLSVILEEMEKL